MKPVTLRPGVFIRATLDDKVVVVQPGEHVPAELRKRLGMHTAAGRPLDVPAAARLPQAWRRKQ